ncbi:inositol monophosphatase family protein [Corynebacterium sp. AOP40-9SA-29]|uniref:inositol monophosphatase family protein n=1 Tax=Corynebacterium sp. AOP40-9SA-29 TaxID=3457677 RepID=UPI00403387AD
MSEQIRLDRTTTDVLPPTAGRALAGRTPDDLRTVAVTVASEAARHVAETRARSAGGDGRIRVEATKSSDVDPVTAIDRSSERLIRQRLGELATHDAVLGEEDGGVLAQDRVTWVVDPVDGTVNLVYGIPASAVSVAACVDGIPVAGAVADIARRRVYSACTGGELVIDKEGAEGAAGSELSELSDLTALSSALVGTGFSYLASRRRAQAELLADLLPEIRDIRRIGSAALDLCAVADGALDAYYEHGLGPWDHSAGSLIAARAGAVVHMPPLSRGYDEGVGVLAAVPGIVDDLAERVLASTFPAPVDAS